MEKYSSRLLYWFGQSLRCKVTTIKKVNPRRAQDEDKIMGTFQQVDVEVEHRYSKGGVHAASGLAPDSDVTSDPDLTSVCTKR